MIKKNPRANKKASGAEATLPIALAEPSPKKAARGRRHAGTDSPLDRPTIHSSLLEAVSRHLLDEVPDLDRLLPRVVETIVSHSGAAGGAIFIGLRHAAELKLRAWRNLPQDFLQKWSTLPLDSAFPDQIIRWPDSIRNVSRLAEDSVLRRLLTSTPSGALIIPLKFRDTVVGLIYLAIPQATRDEAIETALASIGRRLSLVIHNAQSYEAAELRSNKLASVISISATLDRGFKLSQLLNLITQTAAQLLDAESCCLALPTDEGDALEIKSCYGPVHNLLDVRLGMGDTACGRVFLEGWPLVIDSVEEFPLIGAKELDILGHLETAIVVPLLMKSRPLGTLMVINKTNSHEFTPDDQELLSAIGNQAAMALENAILFDKVSQGKAEWENLFDSITDLITVQNKDSRIIRVNKAMAQRLDTLPRNLLRKKCGPVVHGLANNHAACPHLAVMSDLQYREEEAVLPHMDGIFMLSTFPLFDSHRKPYAYVHVLKDITLQKKLEQELVQAQKMESMGTLAGGIAHDFNNILAAIIPNAEMIKRKFPADDALYKRAQMIEQAARRAADLTRQLLSFSRKWKSSVSVLNPNQSITATIELLGRLINKNIILETQLQPTVWNMEANDTQIAQVLLNLALNACDAMREGGTLTFATENMTLDEAACRIKLGLKPGRYVCISVRDTGIGMKREQVARVFEPFYTTKELGKGTGLGLSVVYGIVKNHGGYIEVKSEPGRGTVFSLYFPATSRVIQQEKPTEDEVPRGHGKILVADDEDMVRNMLCELLQDLGYEVIPARDGAEAIDVYVERHAEIDLVILDMIMPKLDGGETYSRLKQMNPHIKAILSSGYSQEGKVQDVIKKGISGFIQKPYSVGEIARVVRDVLNRAGVS
ncbi:MAG: response regulator [Acidobacteria bacterium]|nr:response regulator [Acidobacteriota bacterium]MBI3657245.1 response regulator [Acidobacteriota bacterium]